MPSKITVFRSGVCICETEGIKGEMLLGRLNAAGVSIDAPCGGMGRCGKCLVRLSPDGKQVQACRTPIEGDMEVYLPEESGMDIIETSDTGAEISAGSESGIRKSGFSVAGNSIRKFSVPLGVAVDIGTTTVVAHLTELETGRRIATASGVNAQRPYGADVISRINYCITNGNETLTKIIRKQIKSLINQACADSGTHLQDIKSVAIAANTIMEHLAAGYSPVSMGVVPFTPVSLFGEEHPVWDELPINKSAKIYFAPAVTAYVGGDITAGILAAKLEDSTEPVIFLDIGTNGEIALKTGDVYYCCATAAGPAFEGAEISMGMAATTGAVSHVNWDGELKLSVIGGDKPRGLCGSGLVDALAVLLDTGAVDETGRLLDRDEIDHDIAKYIDEVDGINVFWLNKEEPGDSATEEPGIYVTAADVRKLQLAKSAIAAGIATLLQHSGTPVDQVEALVLAGGFGSYIDLHSAARIRLFPTSLLPVAKACGNTAGEGASLALCSEAAREQLSSIRERCEYIELSASTVFNEQFVEQMMF